MPPADCLLAQNPVGHIRFGGFDRLQQSNQPCSTFGFALRSPLNLIGSCKFRSGKFDPQRRGRIYLNSTTSGRKQQVKGIRSILGHKSNMGASEVAEVSLRKDL